MTKIPELHTGSTRNRKGYLSPIEDFQIPFGIVEGVQYGPTLLITAGVHGSELCSIEAALRLMNIDGHQLTRTLFVLPVMNFHGFRARSIYVNPQDGKSLNRQFPGNPLGTASERLVHWPSGIFPKCDAYLDLHGGNLDEELKPYTIFNEDSEASKQLAVAFGLETVVAASGTRRVSSSYATRLGIPAITAEAVCNGLVSEDKVSLHYDGVMRVMAYLGMLQSPALPLAVPERRFVKLSVPIASAEGLWYPRHRVSAHIAINDILDEVRGIFGEVLVTVTAEVSGEVLYRLPSLWVNSGEQLMGVAYMVPSM
ncbi:hypothetical protein UA08_03071 [Talaromyces atroroseus]|uniref:Succinylglutamate desuccinylase/Aspartoacylase catalytic domain-containing protein n=1 Tax=Talaromyces atroroseus TaxID=1441469 RepID=A0A225B5V5_TALAT|nr:hypothetical protein UA08_03071 [Talaromyces atroroseus]OKL62255.1 hypothetical protein UA08_03071 [Talaromyces atroroseus]